MATMMLAAIWKQDAERIYGVVLKEGTLEPDTDATTKLRAQMKAQKERK